MTSSGNEKIRGKCHHNIVGTGVGKTSTLENHGKKATPHSSRVSLQIKTGRDQVTESHEYGHTKILHH